MDRASGIIMPVFSLPGNYGIGTLGKEAYNFIDFLKKAGQKYWQVLPIGPSGGGNSPYSSCSTFAGNSNFIDIDMLVEDGLVNNNSLLGMDWGKGDIDYNKVEKNKSIILREAFSIGYDRYMNDIITFIFENNWVNEYALYMALKAEFDFKPWIEWDKDIKMREPEALVKYRIKLSEEMNYYIFVQYIFFHQWDRLKRYANKNGIKIIGDLPIYVAMDSVDVWAYSENFLLDENNMPIEVAGVPPDYFSETGQLWGNPLYDWEMMKNDGYGWWIRRIGGANKLFDVIRIDHFRGLASYWAVPLGEKTAMNGQWRKGPGIEFLNRIMGWFNGIKFIAEDLGMLTDDVNELLMESGLPGMKVLEFAFDESRESDYLPYKYQKNCVCYGGTHDNATLKEWKEHGDKKEIEFTMEYFNIGENDDFNYGIIKGGMASTANLFITQMQDYLCLGRESRTNIPGQAEGNWRWRMEKDAASDELAKRILTISKLYGRA